METEAETGGRRSPAQGDVATSPGGRGHQPRDGRLEPPEAARGGKDPHQQPLQGAQPWDTLTSDVWSPGLRVSGPRDSGYKGDGCL